MFGEGELDLDEALGVLTEIGYDGMVAVELSRHSHAAHETVPAAMARAAGGRAGGGGIVTSEDLSAALEERARPEGLAWLREASAAVAADATAIRSRFPMVGRKVGREPLDADADPADVHAWTIDDAARTLLLRRDGRRRPRASSPSSTATATPPSAAASCARCRTSTSATAASTSPTTRSAPTTRG